MHKASPVELRTSIEMAHSLWFLYTSDAAAEHPFLVLGSARTI
ncbi:DUF1382 family protein, partial [Escherichia coli]